WGKILGKSIPFFAYHPKVNRRNRYSSVVHRCKPIFVEPVNSYGFWARTLCRRELHMRNDLASGFSSIPSATGGIARLACDRLRKAQRDLAPVMSGAGLTTEDVEDRKRRLEASAQVIVLELAAKQLQDDCFGFHLARDFELGEIG